MSIGNKIRFRAGIVLPALATLITISLAGVIDPYLAYVATSWIIFGMLALSLDVVWGRGGFLSLAQTAFYGLSAYFGSVITINLMAGGQFHVLWGLPAGALFGATIAAVLGWIIFYARMGPLQGAIFSYTFTLLLWSVSRSFTSRIGKAAIGGDNGMSNIPGYTLGIGPKAAILGPDDAFVFAVIVAAAAYFATRLLMTSPFGKIIDCIRLDIQKTELLGYDVRLYQTLNIAWSGAIAGLAGVLFGAWSNYLNPSIFSVQQALLVPIYVLVGGLGTLAGPFIGALMIGSLTFWLGGGAAGGQATLILGVVLILLVLFLKNGVLGGLAQLIQLWLPRHAQVAHDDGSVSINNAELEHILTEAEAQAGPARPLITSHLYKRIGGVTPIDNVTLSFAPGKPYALIGPNGAGKSSFLKACVGIFDLDRGMVKIGDRDITRTPIFHRVRAGLGVKNQKPQVFAELSVQENLWVAAYSRLRSRAKADEVARAVLIMLGLAAQAELPASALSHGQQQWLDIGMVLCLAPRVILLDEPAAGMTNEETRELADLVRTLARFTTVVVVEHDMEFVRTLEGHVTVLHQGGVFAEGSIDSLRHDDRVLDIYLGRRQHV